MTEPDMLENHPFDEICIGDQAHLQRTLQPQDITLFAAVSGDVNPAHLDAEYASHTPFHSVIAHGMWGGSLISAVLGTQYPGPGTIYLSQDLRFERPVHVGDTLRVQVTVFENQEKNRQVRLDCLCTDQNGKTVIRGSALVMAPAEKVRMPRLGPLQARVTRSDLRYQQLLGLVQHLPRLRVAVVHPCSEDALRGALSAADRGLISPVLVGPLARMQELAASLQLSLDDCTLVDAPHSHGAAVQAVALARSGTVQALMKGSLHTDELMQAVVQADSGLRTGRRISHVFALDVPAYPKPLLISDAAINVVPDLDAKRDIVQNAIDLAHALGLATPKVAILAAVETVNAQMRSTLDAAALCKMAERGQITGAELDGPLAFDNAISLRAAQDKGITSRVAGQADILIAPDLEAANMLAKQLQYLADAHAAGIVLGARVPIILTSRADGASARVASCALAQLLVQAAGPVAS